MFSWKRSAMETWKTYFDCFLRCLCRFMFFLRTRKTKGTNVVHPGSLSIWFVVGYGNKSVSHLDEIVITFNAHYMYICYMFEQISRIELGFGMQLAKSSTLNGCQASLVNIYIYESINGFFVCVGYHIAVCAAIRTMALIYSKKKEREQSCCSLVHLLCSVVLFLCT